MLRTLLILFVVAGFATACSDVNEAPDAIAQDIDIASLPWVEDHTQLTVSLYDKNGNVIDSKEKILLDREYEVVFKTEKPVALYVYKSFGFKFLSEENGEIGISNIHRYKILKTEPGFKQVIFEVYPIYYLDGDLSHEQPQLLVFPEN